jgi:3-phosphoshikimate 1-carboxyvinyltransferase
MNFIVYPPQELIEDGVVSVPLSKSMLNRAFVLSCLTSGSEIPEAQGEECGDVMVMRKAVLALQNDGNSDDSNPLMINVGESGTALRFLCGLVASRPGRPVVLSGMPGLLRRPLAGLVDALRLCGAEIHYLKEEGYAPVLIRGKALVGGELTIDPTISSQFISSLMMVAPLMEQGLKLRFDAEPVSLPYLKMTAEMMRRRGADVDMLPLGVEVAHGSYQPVQETVEGDWSAAAFWYEVVALTAGWISVKGLQMPETSIQGDAIAAKFFECLGVTTEASEEVEGAVALCPSPEVYGRLDLDLTDYPDMTPSLTVTCCMLGVPFKFVGLKSLAIKECDRLHALQEEMAKVGCMLEELSDFGLEWDGKRKPITTMPIFDPRGDHRLAMAFAPISAYIPGIGIRDVQSVYKSYPEYWQLLGSLGFKFIDPDKLPKSEDKEAQE